MENLIPWNEATPEMRAAVCNGPGPWWWPRRWRTALRRWLGWFFSDADWCHHDWGYYWGHPDRATCDRLFLAAMLRDAAAQSTVARMGFACALAWCIFALARLFGWASYARGRKT